MPPSGVGRWKQQRPYYQGSKFMQVCKTTSEWQRALSLLLLPTNLIFWTIQSTQTYWTDYGQLQQRLEASTRNLIGIKAVASTKPKKLLT